MHTHTHSRLNFITALLNDEEVPHWQSSSLPMNERHEHNVNCVCNTLFFHLTCSDFVYSLIFQPNCVQSDIFRFIHWRVERASASVSLNLLLGKRKEEHKTLTWNFDHLFICIQIKLIKYCVMFGQIFVPSLLLFAAKNRTIDCEMNERQHNWIFLSQTY